MISIKAARRLAGETILMQLIAVDKKTYSDEYAEERFFEYRIPTYLPDGGLHALLHILDIFQEKRPLLYKKLLQRAA